MIRFLFAISFFSLLVHSAKSQDIHFSQYKEAPLILNPALTGNNPGDWRAGVNYREQWTRSAIPYNTINFFFDTKVFYYSRIIKVGGYLLVDQANLNGLTKISLAPSIAYRVGYLKNSFSFGLQPGIGTYSIDRLLSHPDQFNYETGKFDNNLPTSDIIENNSKLFADISFGATWSRPLGTLLPQTGIAFYHFNRPETSLYSGGDVFRTPVKTVIHFDLPVKLSDKINVSPSALLIRQRKSQEFIVGADCLYNIVDYTGKIESVFCGTHYRNARSYGMNSLILTGGIDFFNIRVALSYDEYFHNTNNVSLLGSTFEVSIMYRGINTFTDKFSIPCEVY